jgi:excisionase family DNA binding protein
MSDEKKILLTVPEAAALTGFSEGTLRHWISQRRIPFIRISPRCVRLRVVDIEGWISDKVVKPQDAVSRIEIRKGAR